MKEQDVKKLIVDRFGSINAFSDSIDIPNSTVVSIINRGFLNAKLKNVYAICKGLNISPLDLDTGFNFTRSTNIVQGDNHGVNGLDGGSGNTNTYNFGTSNEKQAAHNDSMKAMAVTDVKMSRTLLNLQRETNNKLDQIIKLLESQTHNKNTPD